jgi:hypothetical protein
MNFIQNQTNTIIAIVWPMSVILISTGYSYVYLYKTCRPLRATACLNRQLRLAADQ